MSEAITGHASERIDFVDTTLRDGPHSLWAQRVRVGQLLPAAERLDRAGFRGIEVMGSGNFKKCIRDLLEDPWRKLDLLRERIRTTPMAFMMLPSVTTFDLTPLAVLRLYVERLGAHGIRRLQLMESSNDMSHKMPEMCGFMRAVGIDPILALVYSISPRHTDEHYAQKAAEAARLRPAAIYLKDPAGLLTPERVRTLMPAILANAGDVPVEVHSHCTTGLAPLVYLEAIKAGARIVHTGVPPLANGAAQPSVFNVATNARLLGYEPTVRLDELGEVERHFRAVARAENLPLGAPLEYDASQYLHHIPGGVISHLRHQVGQLGLADRLPEILEEVARVRVELGHPIMVTPLSQFVTSQATLNVIFGARYAQVSDEIIQYTLGHWGKEAAAAVEPAIRERILDRARAREWMKWSPPEPSLAEVRKRLDATDLSDDELLLRYIAPVAEIDRMRAAGAPPLEASAAGPLTRLVEALASRRDLRGVHVGFGDTSITLRRRRDFDNAAH